MKCFNEKVSDIKKMEEVPTSQNSYKWWMNSERKREENNDDEKSLYCFKKWNICVERLKEVQETQIKQIAAH